MRTTVLRAVVAVEAMVVAALLLVLTPSKASATSFACCSDTHCQGTGCVSYDNAYCTFAQVGCVTYGCSGTNDPNCGDT